jgi:hypothetical protein
MVRVNDVREGVDETNSPVARRVYDPNALAARTEQESTLTQELTLSGSDILLGFASALAFTRLLLWTLLKLWLFVP